MTTILVFGFLALCIMAVRLHVRSVDAEIGRSAFPFMVRGFGGNTLSEALLKERRWMLTFSFTRAPLCVRTFKEKVERAFPPDLDECLSNLERLIGAQIEVEVAS